MLNARQWWLIVHMGAGILFVHAFAGGVATLVDADPGPARRRVRGASAFALAAAAWLTVISGTWTVYAWYRAEPPAGAATTGFPKADLLAGPGTAVWHTFGMEWKEHIGWLAPFLATAAAVLAIRHAGLLSREPRVRAAVQRLFSAAFASALVAAGLGAVINTVAPNAFLTN